MYDNINNNIGVRTLLNIIHCPDEWHRVVMLLRTLVIPTYVILYLLDCSLCTPFMVLRDSHTGSSFKASLNPPLQTNIFY